MRQSAIPAIFAAWVTIIMLARPGGVLAADAPVEWLSTEGVRRQLDQPVTLDWSGISLRQAIANLSRSQRVAMLLDRRVDPDQEIEMTVRDVSLDAALQSLALRLKLGASRVGAVIYLGPPDTARRLATVVEIAKEQIGQLPPAIRSPLLTQRSVQWEMLSTPRELLADAGRAYRVRIETLDEVPHDLWPAADLPPIGLAERVSLVLAQFDLTFEVADSGRTLRLVPMPPRPFVARSYRLPVKPEMMKRVTAALEHTEMDTRDGKLFLRGPLEELESVEAILAEKPLRRTTVTAGKKVYQLDVSMPARRLIKELSAKLDLDIEFEEQAIQAAGINLEQDVKITVKNVSQDELLTAVLDPVGLTFKRDGRRLLILPLKQTE